MELIETYLLQALAAMSIAEIIAVIFGIVYIYFAAQNDIRCWYAALVSVSFYIYLCLEAKLYAETGLQVYYWGMAIYGWWSWNGQKSKGELPIKKLTINQHLIIIGSGFLLVLLLGYVLSTNTNAAMPYLDSFTTIFSLITTVLVARKILSNWLYWLVIDAAAVYLYASRELYLTALLFIAYVVIVIFGYIKWKKIYQLQNA